MRTGTALPMAVRSDRAPIPGPVQGRRVFAELRRSRQRAWSGPVRVQFLPARECDETRRVAFAVPRNVGNAVERNRCRRRLRAVVTQAPASVPAGTYLVGIQRGVSDLPFEDLRARVIEAMKRASEATAR